MRQQTFEMIDAQRAAHALQRLAGSLHDVLHEQLAATAEQVRKRDATLGRVEFVFLVDLHPGQGSPLLRQRIAATRELLLVLHELPALGDPLFTIDDAVHGDSFSACASG
jgi:hypothetical protein